MARVHECSIFFFPSQQITFPSKSRSFPCEFLSFVQSIKLRRRIRGFRSRGQTQRRKKQAGDGRATSITNYQTHIFSFAFDARITPCPMPLEPHTCSTSEECDQNLMVLSIITIIIIRIPSIYSFEYLEIKKMGKTY